MVTAALLVSAAPADAVRVTDGATVAHQRLIDRLRGIHDAGQVIAVTTSGYGTSYATLRGWRRTAHGWKRTWGPWPARIGYNGFAPRGDKREGDGRTPTGSFHFQFMFGVYSDPGVRFHFRRALRSSYWDDDSQSANYNRWVDSRYDATGRNPEPMHVSHDSATAGCVSIAQSRVVKVLRWLRPARHPRIIMGTRAAVTS